MDNIITTAGRVGSCLFKRTVWESRKGTSQKAFQVLPVDLLIYDVVFADAQVFGSLEAYTYTAFSDVFTPEGSCSEYLPVSDGIHNKAPAHASTFSAPSLVCVGALQDALPGGEAGDRQKLQLWIQRAVNEGQQITICNTSYHWLVDHNHQIEGVGRLYAYWRSHQTAPRSTAPLAGSPCRCGNGTSPWQLLPE